MANKMFIPFNGCNYKGATMIAGSFTPNGTSAVASSSVKGTRFSVAYGGTAGKWVITLDDKYPDFVAGNVIVQADAASSVTPQLGAYDPVAKTIAIFTVTSGALATLASTNNARIHFVLWMKNSVAPK